MNSLRTPYVGLTSLGVVLPAQQAIGAPCPVCAHCPSLPSSNSAYEAVTGVPGSLIKVGRDIVLRGALIYLGIWLYDLVRGYSDPHRFARSVAGAVGIEGFVLAWTKLNLPPRIQPTLPAAFGAVTFAPRT